MTPDSSTPTPDRPARAERATGAPDLARRVTRWFRANARDLPWRTDPRDPYRSLVSELMLQQTQVARVVERFEPFIARFPSARALAAADEADVLAAWSGLGYYRRARSLHACAQALVERHAGRVPEDAGELRALPGIGAYTAGAISSIVFARAEPAVDGNVVRVLLRVHGSDAPPDAPATLRWAREHAGEMARATDDPGALAEGLMELGALVCTPASPKCDRCPVRAHCAAFEQRRQGDIPAPARAPKKRDLFCASVVCEDSRGRLLVERRPGTGMWASMWQAPTLERDDRAPTPGEIRAHLGASRVARIDAFDHATTHRGVRFEVWRASGARAGAGRVRKSPAQIGALALSTPQRRILLGTP